MMAGRAALISTKPGLDSVAMFLVEGSISPTLRQILRLARPHALKQLLYIECLRSGKLEGSE